MQKPRSQTGKVGFVLAAVLTGSNVLHHWREQAQLGEMSVFSPASLPYPSKCSSDVITCKTLRKTSRITSGNDLLFVWISNLQFTHAAVLKPYIQMVVFCGVISPCFVSTQVLKHVVVRSPTASHWLSCIPACYGALGYDLVVPFFALSIQQLQRAS